MHLFLKLLIGTVLLNCLLADDDFSLFEGDGKIEHFNKTIGSFKPHDPDLKLGVYRWVLEPIPLNKTKKMEISLWFDYLFLHENDVVTVFKNLTDSNNNSNSIISPIHAQNGSITIITDEPTLVVKLEGHTTAFMRRFQVSYTSEACAFTAMPDMKIIHSPIYIGNKSSRDCKYTFNHDTHFREIPVFLFDLFNFTTSGVELEGTSNDGPYEKNTRMDFFMQASSHAAHITVSLKTKNEYFRLIRHFVDSKCSGYTELNSPNMVTIESPNYELNNGTFGSECLWILKHTTPSVLGINLVELNFTNVLDIVAINDGGSSISPPLTQLTTSNMNHNNGEIIRSSGPSLWISFKPVSYSSKFKANITVHGQGGYFKSKGQINMTSTVGNDTVFMLEVEENKVVLLNFTESNFAFPATLKIYDGFDTKKLLTTLHQNVGYPVLSTTSRMMIIATAFEKGSFKADFSGMSSSCLHMSSLSNENYVLSGNCNDTCLWVVSPQDVPGSDLLLNIQYISLEKEDVVEIHQLDKTKSLIGTVTSTMTHVPQMLFPANVGVLVNVTRAKCMKENDVVLVGHSSYVPACGGRMELTGGRTFFVNSPLYPDTYPLMAKCIWTLSTPSKSLTHLTFHKLALASNDRVKIINSFNNVTYDFVVSHLPDDLFLSNGSTIEFSSSQSITSNKPIEMVSSQGFSINGTVAECGAIFENKLTGEFNINVSSLSQALCVWKINVPEKNVEVKDSVNVIVYTLSIKEDKGNYDLKIYDGASVRDSQIVNISSSELWSRSNSLIIVYKREKVTIPSTVFVLKYKALTCDSTMLCANKVCMHPDWKCNGINDCGDFTDEKNCASVPIPEKEKTGYTSAAFWGTFITMFVLLIAAAVGPFIHQKFKDRQYSRFSDISTIE